MSKQQDNITIEHLDLSDYSIEAFPDLSAYTIKLLDISHNMIDTLDWRMLPKGIERFDISHNNLRDLKLGYRKIYWRPKTAENTTVKYLDCSHNTIRYIGVIGVIDTVIANHNKQHYSSIYATRKMKFLDVLYNKEYVLELLTSSLANSYKYDSIKKVISDYKEYDSI